MKKLKDVINNIIQSFSNEQGGWSARKLTAFWFVMLTTYLEVKFCNNVTLLEIVIVNILLILLLLGIITFEQIIKFRSGSNNEKQNSANTSGNNSADSSNNVN